MTLLAFAAERRAAGRPPLSIDNSRPPGQQQQSLLLWSMLGQMDGQTDGYHTIS